MPYGEIERIIREHPEGIRPVKVARAAGVNVNSLYSAITNLTYWGALAEDDKGRLMYVS